jgi:hypothetical protein
LSNGKNAVHQGDEGDHGKMGRWKGIKVQKVQEMRGRIKKGTIGILD